MKLSIFREKTETWGIKTLCLLLACSLVSSLGYTIDNNAIHSTTDNHWSSVYMGTENDPLLPGKYTMTTFSLAASSELYLAKGTNGTNNPTFEILISAALSTGASAKIVCDNFTDATNVFFRVSGFYIYHIKRTFLMMFILIYTNTQRLA